MASVALGACLIEKHFTLDQNMEGWDHKISATKNEMIDIVVNSRRIADALGSKVEWLLLNQMKKSENSEEVLL